MEFETVFVLGLLVVVSAQYTINDCPSVVPRDRFLRVYGNSCYYFVLNHEREFGTAEKECEARHGHLVVIRDAATNQFLYNTLKNELHYNGVVFIGLSDERREGTWTWVDGSHATYTNWAPGQPGLLGFAEDCAAMEVSTGGQWHDYGCDDLLFFDNSHTFICEYPVIKTTATTSTTTTTTTPLPTTTTAPPTTTTPEPTTTTPEPTTTTTTALPEETTHDHGNHGQNTHPTNRGHHNDETTTAAGGCPAFECSLDCGLDGFTIDENGCMICECVGT